MENACVIVEWFISEAKRVFAVLAGERANGELTAEQREIMRRIQKIGGEVKIQMLRDSIGKYHKEGGTERLKRELDGMVSEGYLNVSNKKANNGREMEFYSIPAPTISKTEE